MVACCMCCVFDSRPAETFVKFCPAKPGVVWSILSLENFNFCNAGFHCQCFVFMHLLHPNPTPNSICLEPSCHVNQTSSPCHWTCRHRCGQFHSRRPGCGNILAQFFEIVSGADGGWFWGPEGAKQIKLYCSGWKLNRAFFDTERDICTHTYIYIYRYILCTFVHVPSSTCPFPSVCGSEEMSSQLSKVVCQISRGMARHCSPAAPAALTIPTMSMRRIQVAEVAEVATWFWPIFRSWRHLGVVCTLPLKKVASPSHRYKTLLDFVFTMVNMVGACRWAETFGDERGRPLSFEAFNLYHANYWIIGPATAATDAHEACSYVELLGFRS